MEMTVYYTRLPEVKSGSSASALQREAGRRLLAEALARAYGIDRKQSGLEFWYGERGKPYFRDLDLFFNISHSGAFAVCALDTQELGIDIQEIKAIRPNVLRRFLACEETEPLAQTVRWTEYESYAKKTGSGIPLPAEEYKKGYFLHSFALENYVIAVCTDNRALTEIRLEYVDHMWDDSAAAGGEQRLTP